MKRFTDAGRTAVEQQNWYAALSLALMMPEICGSLEDPGPNKSKKRYVSWCQKWLVPEMTSGEMVFLSAEDCYQLRCSVIHSGTADIEPSKVDVITRVMFFSEGPHMGLVTGNIFNGVEIPSFLQMRVDKFAETMFALADEWDASVKGNEPIQLEKKRLLFIHPPGTVVGGVKFG